jgi:hypothetical protein
MPIAIKVAMTIFSLKERLILIMNASGRSAQMPSVRAKNAIKYVSVYEVGTLYI